MSRIIEAFTRTRFERTGVDEIIMALVIFGVIASGWGILWGLHWIELRRRGWRK